MKSFRLFFAALFLLGVTVYGQTSWSFDKAHSNVGFSVSHMVISDVEGEFGSFEGSFNSSSEKDFADSKLEFTVDVNSINTDNTDRDNHLKSDDFFNAAAFPKMTFKSKKFEKTGENKYKVTGDLTIRDVTKEVTLDVEHRGTITDPWGNTRAGFKLEGALNRFDYGLKWNQALETGGLVVGKEVSIKADVEVIKKS